MLTQLPQVTGMSHRFSGGGRRDNIFVVPCIRAIAKNDVDFAAFESCQFQVELKIDETLEFNRKDIFVPARLSSKFVVRNDVRTLLGYAEMSDADNWDGRPPESFGTFNAPMSRKNLAGFIDQDRIRESKVLDRTLNLFDLAGRMDAGVVRGGTQ
jgi:hypothetical protein